MEFHRHGEGSFRAIEVKEYGPGVLSGSPGTEKFYG